MTPDQIMVWLEVGIVVLLIIEIGLMCLSVSIQIDDVYGFTQLKKSSRRKLRRVYKTFLKTSADYFKGKHHAKI